MRSLHFNFNFSFFKQQPIRSRGRLVHSTEFNFSSWPFIPHYPNLYQIEWPRLLPPILLRMRDNLLRDCLMKRNTTRAPTRRSMTLRVLMALWAMGLLTASTGCWFTTERHLSARETASSWVIWHRERQAVVLLRLLINNYNQISIVNHNHINSSFTNT